MAISEDEEDEFLGAGQAELLDQLYQGGDNYRSGAVASKTESTLDGGQINSKDFGGPSSEFFPTCSQHDLSVLHCFTNSDVKDVWEGLKEFFNEPNQVDHEVNENGRLVFGNYYKSPQDVSFLSSVAQMDDGTTSVLDVRRLSGDAFLLNDFFKEMKDYLKEASDVTWNGEDDDDDESFEDDDEDYPFADEFEEDGMELPDFGDPGQTMMEFEYDTDLLYMMIADFASTHLEEKNYFMSMLSHNAQRKENRELMLEKNWVGKVTSLINDQLNADKDKCDAALIRNTCLFLKNIAVDMEVEETTLLAAVKAMGDWCPNPEGKEYGRVVGYLQSSRQSMIELSEFLTELEKDDHLEKLMREQLPELVYNRICEYAQDRDELNSGVLSRFDKIIVTEKTAGF